MNDWLGKLILVVGIATLNFVPLRACTIFVLTDGERTLFCNNEDWKDPNTRIWFVPASEGAFGAAYVGFDNGWAQGGLNTEGLAFDWVAGFQEKWERDPSLKAVRGNPSPLMLESCRTVDQAIAFYQKHWEPDFSRSRIMIADRTGASVIIGALDGKLFVQKASQCRGFGYGRDTVNKALANPPKPTVANGLQILNASRQEGEFGTKYSNIFDLQTGDIFLLQPGEKKELKLNLTGELKKGPHYYELPRIRAQLAQSPLPLPARMHRLPMDTAKPALQDDQPELTAHLASLLRDAIAGKMRAEHYSPELWEELAKSQEQIQEDLKALGTFIGLTVVERVGTGRERVHRYRVEFSKAIVLQSFSFTDNKLVTASESEMIEWKSEQP